MPILDKAHSCEILADPRYPQLYLYTDERGISISTEPLAHKYPQWVLPNITAPMLGDAAFRTAHRTKYAYCAGAMANGIASADLVIALGKNGMLGSYGSGGCSLEQIAQDIDKIQAALCDDAPYMINMLHNRNAAEEMALAKLLIAKNVRQVEASAYIQMSEALVYYRLNGVTQRADGTIAIAHAIMAKVSREEVLRAFAAPPDPKLVASLLAQGLITEQEAALSQSIPMADDITVEADSGGHTDARPLVSILPALIALNHSLQVQYGYQTPVRIGAGGGIGTGLSALGAFQLGAAYVMTGSVNQSCVEAGTSDYVKQLLAETAMADITMAPCADMFEMGAKVEVLKKKTMYAQNAQKLYEYYVKYPSYAAIPAAEQQKIETRILKKPYAEIWGMTQDYFRRVDPRQLDKAAQNEKYQMALVFRWYLGSSSRWAVNGDLTRATDMQIWCGQAMGAFNLWVQGTALQQPAQRKAAEVGALIMRTCAYAYMKSLCVTLGSDPALFEADPLRAYLVAGDGC